MLILLQDSLPNLIGDSREEETFCVDTKHRRQDKNTGRQNLGIYCGCSKCHVLNNVLMNSDVGCFLSLYANTAPQTLEEV